MDQLKEFLGLVKRQHFWFIAPLVLILAGVAWFIGSGKVAEETNKHVSDISSSFSKVDSVRTVNEDGFGHPNENWHSEMESLINARRDNVKQAWTKKWDRQKSLLVWPNELPQDFRNRVEPLRPIESKFDPKRDPLSDPPRTAYARYIKQTLPKLAESIGSKWAPSMNAGGREGGGFGTGGFEGRSIEGSGRRGGRGERSGFADEDEGVIVRWNSGNQGQIAAAFDWGTGVPTTLEVLYAQEDLWVLQALMDIIADTNQGAITNSTASVKEIVAISLGKDVPPLEQLGFKVVRPTAPPTGGEGDEGEQTTTLAEPPMTTELVPDREPSMDGGELGPPKKPHPAVKRYVDADFKPIEDLAVLQSSLDIAKRMPVRMRVRMDQRYINRLLVACANSPLTFEVRQFRFNPQGASMTGSGSGEFGGFGERGEGRSFAAQTAVRTITDVDTFERTIEIYGIIYLFNPVNDQLLSGGEATSTGGEDAI